MSPNPHETRIDKLFEDIYFGRDADNPSLTARTKSLEDWRTRVEVADEKKKDRLNTKMNILITAALGLLAALIANHFKLT